MVLQPVRQCRYKSKILSWDSERYATRSVLDSEEHQQPQLWKVLYHAHRTTDLMTVWVILDHGWRRGRLWFGGMKTKYGSDKSPIWGTKTGNDRMVVGTLMHEIPLRKHCTSKWQKVGLPLIVEFQAGENDVLGSKLVEMLEAHWGESWYKLWAPLHPPGRFHRAGPSGPLKI